MCVLMYWESDLRSEKTPTLNGSNVAGTMNAIGIRGCTALPLCFLYCLDPDESPVWLAGEKRLLCLPVVTARLRPAAWPPPLLDWLRIRGPSKIQESPIWDILESTQLVSLCYDISGAAADNGWRAGNTSLTVSRVSPEGLRRALAFDRCYIPAMTAYHMNLA
jgi:hypothetical protein